MKTSVTGMNPSGLPQNLVTMNLSGFSIKKHVTAMNRFVYTIKKSVYTMNRLDTSTKQNLIYYILFI